MCAPDKEGTFRYPKFDSLITVQARYVQPKSSINQCVRTEIPNPV